MVAALMAGLFMERGYEAGDLRTAREVGRWSRADRSVLSLGRGADHLRRLGHDADLNFALSHVDDLDLVCLYSDSEIRSTASVAPQLEVAAARERPLFRADRAMRWIQIPTSRSRRALCIGIESGILLASFLAAVGLRFLGRPRKSGTPSWSQGTRDGGRPAGRALLRRPLRGLHHARPCGAAAADHQGLPGSHGRPRPSLLPDSRHPLRPRHRGLLHAPEPRWRSSPGVSRACVSGVSEAMRDARADPRHRGGRAGPGARDAGAGAPGVPGGRVRGRGPRGGGSPAREPRRDRYPRRPADAGRAREGQPRSWSPWRTSAASCP